ncbi:MAG: DSD1 family PLP-dependent enzyme [Bryobacterales bacterium]
MKKTIAAATVAGPTVLLGRASAYSLTEIEKHLQSNKGISGVTKNDLPTPALLVDLDRLEANIRRMADHAKNAGVQLRPHAKTHKCVEIARRQLEAGAIGACTATIREAEALSFEGIGGLLITSEMVGPNKMERLIRLTKQRPETMSVVDNPWHAEQLSEAAQAAKVQLNVMVDIDPMGRRTGTEPGKKAVELAKKIDQLPNLKLRGVHGYSGASSHVEGFEARKEHSAKVMGPVIDSFRQMQRDGLPAEIMSGASTGTYNIDPALGGMTELQVGSYVFMDVDYRKIGGQSGGVYEDFQPALTVLATVISKNYDDRATTDAGLKAFATDRKFGPEVVGVQGVDYRFGGDEHGILQWEHPSREIRLGEKLEMLVPHCDPNVNLYDRIFCVRGDQVREVWKVTARGHV